MRLYEAARIGTLEDIKTAFEACDAKERKRFGPNTLRFAARDSGSRGLEILNREASRAQRVEFLMEREVKPYEKDINGYTVFTEALSHKNFAVADYLLLRDDFVLSDLMPRPRDLQADIYKEHRAKAIARVSELVDAKGISFAKMVAADIEKILKSEKPKPTTEDVETLGIIAKKIATKDWVADAQVSSDAFMSCEMER